MGFCNVGRLRWYVNSVNPPTKDLHTFQRRLLRALCLTPSGYDRCMIERLASLPYFQACRQCEIGSRLFVHQLEEIPILLVSRRSSITCHGPNRHVTELRLETLKYLSSISESSPWSTSLAVFCSTATDIFSSTWFFKNPHHEP